MSPPPPPPLAPSPPLFPFATLPPARSQRCYPPLVVLNRGFLLSLHCLHAETRRCQPPTHGGPCLPPLTPSPPFPSLAAPYLRFPRAPPAVLPGTWPALAYSAAESLMLELAYVRDKKRGMDGSILKLLKVGG